MKVIPKKNNIGNFAIADQVLLMFNEHDSKIALNWEIRAPARASPDDVAPPPAPVRP